MGNNIFTCSVHGDLPDEGIMYSKNGKYIHKRCKLCEKEKALLRRMGISKEQKNELLIKQNHGCKICHKKIYFLFSNESSNCLYVDHCHKTNEVRGLLCASCNSGIGKFKENLNLMQKAIEWCICT